MTGPRVAPGRLPENEKGFQGWIVDYATLVGWEVYHPWLSIRSADGWPDLALCRPPRFVLAEVKAATGKLSRAQQKWQTLLEACPGVEVYTWWPKDRDTITRILARVPR